MRPRRGGFSSAEHGTPKTITIDKSGASTAAIINYNKDCGARIARQRQCKYLNNTVEQNHRAIKRIVRPNAGLPLCANLASRYRDDAHDPEGAAGWFGPLDRLRG
jgi:transposase-like protein